MARKHNRIRLLGGNGVAFLCSFCRGEDRRIFYGAELMRDFSIQEMVNMDV